MLEKWTANTKRILSHDEIGGADYEFTSKFPDGVPDGTAFSAENMNKIIDAVNGNTETTDYITENDRYIVNTGQVTKLPGGLMIISGTYPLTAAALNGNSGMHEFTASFPEKFARSPYVQSTAEYNQGLISTCVCSATTTSARIGSSSGVNGGWVTWVAIGRWKA